MGDVYDLIKPAMVLIETDSKIGGSGSGFFITDSTIVTNAHVVKGAYDIQVKSNNNKYYSASVQRIDLNIDLAILKIQAPGEKFNYVYQRKALKDAKAGQEVVAIGHPFGLENTVSSGIVSGFREEDGIKYIQMTAPISPGNSGGPLLTMDGEVMGVNSWQKVNGQNLNFAVPIDYYEKVRDSKELNLDDDITQFIKAKSEWYAKLKGFDDDLKDISKGVKDERFAECSSKIKNIILPKIDESRRLANSFSSNNSDARDCAKQWVLCMDNSYNVFKYASTLFDQVASKHASSQSSKSYILDLLDDLKVSGKEYDAKCDKLWKKYYKQSDTK